MNSSDPTDSFLSFRKEWNADPTNCAEELLIRFGYQLVCVAASSLNQASKILEDPEDIAQSTWKSFFRKSADWEFENWQTVWGLLATIVDRKCARKYRYWSASKRNMNQVSADPEKIENLVSKGTASADIRIEFTEAMDTALGMAKDDRDREIFLRYLVGERIPEIALCYKISDRTVERRIHSIVTGIRELYESTD